jgi:hypothetical protein
VASAIDVQSIPLPDPQLIAIVKKKTPLQRVEMALEMNRRVRHEIHELLRRRIPDASDAEVQTALAETMLTESIPDEVDVKAIERQVILESAEC